MMTVELFFFWTKAIKLCDYAVIVFNLGHQEKCIVGKYV